MVEVGIVPPSDVEKHQNILRPFVRKMDRAVPGQWTWEYVKREAELSRLHLWIASDGKSLLMVVGCRFEQLPGGRRYYDIMFAAGGHLAGVFHPMMDKFEEVAKAAGAVVRVPIGRRGWKRLMTERGMKVTGYCYEAT